MFARNRTEKTLFASPASIYFGQITLPARSEYPCLFSTGIETIIFNNGFLMRWVFAHNTPPTLAVRVKYTENEIFDSNETRPNRKEKAKQWWCAPFNSTICLAFFFTFWPHSCDFNEKLQRNRMNTPVNRARQYTHFNNNNPMNIFFAHVRRSISKWVEILKFYKVASVSIYTSHRSHSFIGSLEINMCRFRLHTIVIYLTWGHFLLSFSSEPQSNGGSLFPMRHPSYGF